MLRVNVLVSGMLALSGRWIGAARAVALAMSRILLAVLVLIASCSAEVEDEPTEPVCEDGSPCSGYGAVCRGGTCVIGGVYGDCPNNAYGCGASDLAVCVTDDPMLLTGVGVCSKGCTSDADCWWALPDPDYPASCVLLDGFDDSYCVIECIDGSCPVDMLCRGDICVFEADGCGPTANPAEGSTCECDVGMQWCDSEGLDCCPIPGGGGGGGGGGCCRTCTSGKPCGDACIAFDLTCHQPAGCAC